MAEKAQVGDLIRLVKAMSSVTYKNGDVFEVVRRGGLNDCGVGVKEHDVFIFDIEYVIHRKAGEEDSLLETVEKAVETQNETPKVLVGTLTDGTPLYLRAETQEETQTDAVDHPSHYTQGRFETIEIIEEITQGYSDGYVSYCVGNALKYLARAPFKHESPAEDLAKAEAYIRFALNRINGSKR